MPVNFVVDNLTLDERNQDMIEVVVIAAVARNSVIGIDNKIPWRISEDMQHFKDMTSGNIVIMGRNTYESIGSKPLPGRINIVISSRYPNGTAVVQEGRGIVKRNEYVMFFKSLTHAVDYCRTITQLTNRTVPVYLMGGHQIYTEGLQIAEKLIVTHVQAEYSGDVFFPMVDKSNWLPINLDPYVSKDEDIPFYIGTYRRISRSGVDGNMGHVVDLMQPAHH